MKKLQFLAVIAFAALLSTQAMAQAEELSASDKALVTDVLMKSGLSQADAEKAIATKTLKDSKFNFCTVCRAVGQAAGDAGAATACAEDQPFFDCILYMGVNISSYVQTAMNRYQTTCDTVTKTKFISCLTLPEDTKKLLSLVCPNFSCP